jgi:hypothetical protein
MLTLLSLACVLPSTDSGDSAALGCTEIGCTNGLDLAFTLDDPGHWTVRASLDDGTTLSCEASLPLSGDERCDAGMSLSLSGSALPADQQAITGAYLETTSAASVRLVIEDDHGFYFDVLIEPEYEVLQPNGPECGPTCTYASETLVPVSNGGC